MMKMPRTVRPVVVILSYCSGYLNRSRPGADDETQFRNLDIFHSLCMCRAALRNEDSDIHALLVRTNTDDTQGTLHNWSTSTAAGMRPRRHHSTRPRRTCCAHCSLRVYAIAIIEHSEKMNYIVENVRAVLSFSHTTLCRHQRHFTQHCHAISRGRVTCNACVSLRLERLKFSVIT